MALTPEPVTASGDADLAGRAETVLTVRWPQAAVAGVEQLQGGASGLTYRAWLAGAPVPEVVIKVAPAGLPPVRNRDVLRQARLLSLLAGQAGVRVPRVFGCDPGDPPQCPPLFVMSFEPGTSEEPLHVAAEVPPEDIRGRALQAAQMLAALHAVPVDDLEGAGETDEASQPSRAVAGAKPAAEPVLTPQQEVERWVRALRTVPAELRPGADETAARLLARVPAAIEPAICHGDWRLGNLLSVDADVIAAIDWEIWSIGDSRADLSWFLMMCDPAHPAAIAGPEVGLPAIDELTAAYIARAGGNVRDLAWFRALAAFKQAAVTALLAKHAAQRAAPLEQVAARLASLLPELQVWSRGFLAERDEGS
ncbi:MAG: phosphotransferase family protein [Streptosporangiaceae bacterium]